MTELLNDKEANVGLSDSNVGLGVSYEQKCVMAIRAKAGDVWVSIKTGRKATITGNSWRCVSILHETGRKTQKQHHYFAYDYTPNV